MRSIALADAWSSGRNNFNLIRLFAAWLVIYGHAWAITGSEGGDLVTHLTRFKFAGGVAVDAGPITLMNRDQMELGGIRLEFLER